MTLSEINAKLKATDVKGKPYVEVNQRVIGFRELFPDGTITTEILNMADGVITMKATVSVDGKVLATGHAQEKETSSYINKTSYVENCETSAIGRALGILGIGATESIASAEEVTNAIANQNAPAPTAKPAETKSKPTLKPALLQEAQKLDIDLNKVEAYFKTALTNELLESAIETKRKALSRGKKNV